ncbi:MAG: DUF948 domain-containing protein [Parachlamydiaceae bacterium]|nr:DUF948 domain-containing protein [Parachlamydiaceae bacterium]
MIIEISIAIIAVAFVVLVIYLVATLKSLGITLGQVNITLSDGRKQIDDVLEETKKVIEHTNNISADIQKKVEYFDPLFKTVEDLGGILEHRTASFREKIEAEEEETVHARIAANRHLRSEKTKVTEKSTEKSEDPVKLVADIVELTSLGIRLWQNFKKRS